MLGKVKHMLPNGGDLMVAYHATIRQKSPKRNKSKHFCEAQAPKFDDLEKITQQKLT